MRHRSKHTLFDVGKHQKGKTRTSSTFTLGKNSHLTRKNKLHSKSTYFYRWGSRINYVVPSMCALALLVGEIICINPILDNSKAYAEELDFDATDNVSTDAASTDTTNADSGIMTASDPSITLNITPDSGNNNGDVKVGEVAYFSNTITVGGTGISKYYLALSTPNGNSGNLVGKEHPIATVGKVAYGTVPANFGDNTWGYAVSDNTGVANSSLTYNPVPSGTSGNNSVYLAAKNSMPATAGDTYKLVFAAKLGSNMPGDHYQTSVYISAVADADVNVAATTNWFVESAGITTMQQMNSAICGLAPEDAASQLVDSRDGKSYWVTKLRDGNCWMTQNLAYGTASDINIGTPCTLNGVTNSSTCSGWDNSYTNKYFAIGEHREAHNSRGNYYNWLAAVAGDTSTAESKQGICPKGWQLPTGGDSVNSKSFGGLMNAYKISGSTNRDKIADDPLYFQYGGRVINSNVEHAGTNGNYWSSTPHPSSSTNAYNLYFDSYKVSTNSGGSLIDGFSVRCVAK